MRNTSALNVVSGSLFAALLVLIGVLNLVLVHPVPGVAYLLLSVLYLPATNPFLLRRLGFAVPAVVKVMLGFVVIWFTLGISDLGDMFV